MPSVSIGSTNYNVTLGYSPSLKVTRESSGLQGVQGTQGVGGFIGTDGLYSQLGHFLNCPPDPAD